MVHAPRLLQTVALIIVFALCAFLLLFKPHSASSQSGTILMSGYVWSDTIGWISLSGSGYGISIASDGSMSGYAWSDNIGWISANSADLTGCPSGTCTARDTNGVFSGWLKAIAGSGSSTGGWNGFIALSGPGYGVTESNGVVSGYAWGDANVGWIDFSGTTPFAPACTLTPNTTQIVKGNTATLSWTSTRSVSGTIAPGSLSAAPVSSGSIGVQPNATTTYTGTFSGAGGSSQCTATINVQCAPVYSCSGAVGGDGNQHTIAYTTAGCVTADVTTCTTPSFCSAGQSTCQWPSIIISSPGGTLTGHLQAQPSILHPGDTTHLYWNISNATSCTVSGGGQSWTQLSSGAGGILTNAISQTTIYTLACTAYQGNTNLNETLQVNVQPLFREQ